LGSCTISTARLSRSRDTIVYLMTFGDVVVIDTSCVGGQSTG
jgi:hypothetical protein